MVLETSTRSHISRVSDLAMLRSNRSWLIGLFSPPPTVSHSIFASQMFSLTKVMLYGTSFDFENIHMVHIAKFL